MKYYIKKVTALLSSMGMVLLFSAFISFEQNANFSGTWMLNYEKSDVGNAPIPKSGKSIVKVLSQAPILVIEKSITDSLGQLHTGTDSLAFGKTITLDAGSGQQIQRTMTQEWSADKQVMKLVSKYNADNNGEEPVEFEGTES